MSVGAYEWYGHRIFVGLASVTLAVLVFLPSAAAAPFFVAVAPDLPGPGPGDEGFAVGCNDSLDLGGYSVTDGRGIFAFPPTTCSAGEGVWVVGNATTWQHFGGARPAAVWDDARLQLGNARDALRLQDAAGRVVDSFSWGPAGMVNLTSPGLVYARDEADGGWLVSGTASDWVTPRIHRIGESHLDAPTWTVHDLTLYASPDSSFGVLESLVAGAVHRLYLHVYELRSTALVDALVAAKAAHPSLELAVLVEAAPVGMTSPERHATADALRRIELAGGSVVLASHGRYDDHHLKVLVADDAVAVQSENWVESGVPEDPTWGNRGWGAVLHDAAPAEWFASWMAADRAAWDVTPFSLAAFDPLFVVPPRTVARSGDYGPIVPATHLTGGFAVTALVAPDQTADPRHDPVAAIVANATTAIRGEELEIAVTASNALGWRGLDPLLAGFESAADRGVDVRVLAAAPFGSSDGNRAALQAIASSGGSAGVLRRPGLALLHNKGIVADDVVVLGSMNGNHHSRSANREVDLVLRGPGVADYFRALYDGDEAGARRGPDVGVIGRDLRGLPATPWPMLLAALAVASVIRSRR